MVEGRWNVVGRLRNDAVAAHYRKRQPPLEFMKLQFRPPRCTASEQFVSQRTKVKIIQSHLPLFPDFFLALWCGIVRCNCRDSSHVEQYRFSPRAAIIREFNNNFHCARNIISVRVAGIEFNWKMRYQKQCRGYNRIISGNLWQIKKFVYIFISWNKE